MSHYTPCRSARISVGGAAVPAGPGVEEAEPPSTAFLAIDESRTRTGW
jgi:hypothetical protein